MAFLGRRRRTHHPHQWVEPAEQKSERFARRVLIEPVVGDGEFGEVVDRSTVPRSAFAAADWAGSGITQRHEHRAPTIHGVEEPAGERPHLGFEAAAGLLDECDQLSIDPFRFSPIQLDEQIVAVVEMLVDERPSDLGTFGDAADGDGGLTVGGQ